MIWLYTFITGVPYAPFFWKLLAPIIKTGSNSILDKKILEKLTKYEIIINEIIKKSYKNLIIDFVLILIMLTISFHAKMKSYEVLMLFLLSVVYLFSLFLILRRYVLLFKLYKQHKPLIDTYYPIWKSTKAKKIGEKKREFIELAYMDMYRKEVNPVWSILHDGLALAGFVKDKKEVLEHILDRVNHIYKSSLRKNIVLYLTALVLIIGCSYSIKWLLIDVNTGFTFIDYIIYPFKQLYFIWFK